MGAVMDDTVHIEVEVVELGDSILSNELRDGGIALREPAEELWDTWAMLVLQALCTKLDRVPMMTAAAVSQGGLRR